MTVADYKTWATGKADERLLSLLMREDSDVELSLDKDKCLPAHSQLLSMSSPVLVLYTLYLCPSWQPLHFHSYSHLITTIISHMLP